MNPVIELQHLHFRQYQPTAELASIIQFYWLADADLGDASTHEYLYPDGGCSIVLNLAEPQPGIVGAEAYSVMMSSPITKAYSQTFTGRVRTIGIRFLPGAFSAAVDSSVEGPLYQPLPVLLKQHLNTDRLLQNLLNSVSDFELVTILDAHFKSVLSAESVDQNIVDLVSWLRVQQIPLNIPAIADKSGFTQRTLERRFRKALGMTAKQLVSLLRVSSARQMLKQGDVAGVEVALAAGYYDQPHFIREFRKITGVTPGAYLKRRQRVAR